MVPDRLKGLQPDFRQQLELALLSSRLACRCAFAWAKRKEEISRGVEEEEEEERIRRWEGGEFSSRRRFTSPNCPTRTAGGGATSRTPDIPREGDFSIGEGRQNLHRLDRETRRGTSRRS